MALIIGGKSTCPICNHILEDGDDLVATTHFIADKTDPLWRYSDSAIHRSCFLSWSIDRSLSSSTTKLLDTSFWEMVHVIECNSTGQSSSIVRKESLQDDARIQEGG